MPIVLNDMTRLIVELHGRGDWPSLPPDMPLGKYQIRVVLKGVELHSSGTNVYATAIARCDTETLKVGVGALGSVYEHTTGKPDALIYAARVGYEGDDGTMVIKPEDLTSPPPEHHG